MILDRAKKIFNLLEGLQTRNVMQFATKCNAVCNEMSRIPKFYYFRLHFS